MALKPCNRCGGWMMPGYGRETYCVNCGNLRHNAPILQTLDIEDSEKHRRARPLGQLSSIRRPKTSTLTHGDGETLLYGAVRTW